MGTGSDTSGDPINLNSGGGIIIYGIECIKDRDPLYVYTVEIDVFD